MPGKLLTYTLRLGALTVGVLSLAACSEQHTMAANPKICTDFKTKAAVATAAPIADGSAPTDECARRWAYSLAPSRDGADVVAEAVVAACTGALAQWNQQAMQLPADGQMGASLTTGEPTTPMGEHNNFLRSRALLYVVQARAGACAPPPATNGVPEGVTG
jgi:hypothetical protein